jgi:hypothetical protein
MDLLFNQEKQFYNSTLALPTHSGIHDLFLNYSTWNISSPAAVALLYHVMQLTWFP